jgi:inositol-hexakisphosphate/diphosphoinositol-pentakisphosphate 1-kinase
MLHNPHLGLSDTFDKLYDMAKVMADCVVPQGKWIFTRFAPKYELQIYSHKILISAHVFLEYGTTIPEKRSVGVKICRGLLEKIKFDLVVARTDNDVDMR